MHHLRALISLTLCVAVIWADYVPQIAVEFPYERPLEPLPQCFEPKVEGPCRRFIPRFYFDAIGGTCKSFIYGGCNGNNNNFFTLEQCKAFCMP
ncbi:zinc-containing alcohol dehydrogenase [Sparganum proliferum]